MLSGTNGYETLGGKEPKPLTEDEINSYQTMRSLNKNVICVANGLYLEIIKEKKDGRERKITRGRFVFVSIQFFLFRPKMT